MEEWPEQSLHFLHSQYSILSSSMPLKPSLEQWLHHV